MHAKVDNSEEDLIPFAYVVVHEGGKPGWAIVSAPRRNHEAFTEAVKNGTSHGVQINLMSLIEAFNGKVTKSGWGQIPDEEREDLHMLYGGQDPEQGSLDI